MSIRDSLFTWFIQNVISPNVEIIDKPGFVVTSFTEKGRETYLRVLFLEEKLFEMIENGIIENYGDEGRKTLYSAGKKFGYLYAALSNFVKYDGIKNNEKEFKEFGYFLVRYVATIYAKDAKYELVLDQKKLVLDFDNYIVCRKNGNGYLMASGGIAGIWAYMVQDQSVEGKQTKCQGKGDESCQIIVQPAKNFLPNEIFTETNLVAQQFTEIYKKKNIIRPTQFAKNSLKTLIDSHFFNYENGALNYKKTRYFLCESNIIYIIENEIESLENGQKKLFDICFQYGKILQNVYGGKDFSRFLGDYIPALGWGDLIIGRKDSITITINFYPFSNFSEKSNYTIISGILSGFISACLGKDTTFNKISIKNSDFLTVTFNEN